MHRRHAGKPAGKGGHLPAAPAGRATCACARVPRRRSQSAVPGNRFVCVWFYAPKRLQSCALQSCVCTLPRAVPVCRRQAPHMSICEGALPNPGCASSWNSWYCCQAFYQSFPAPAQSVKLVSPSPAPAPPLHPPARGRSSPGRASSGPGRALSAAPSSAPAAAADPAGPGARAPPTGVPCPAKRVPGHAPKCK